MTHQQDRTLANDCFSDTINGNAGGFNGQRESEEPEDRREVRGDGASVVDPTRCTLLRNHRAPSVDGSEGRLPPARQRITAELHLLLQETVTPTLCASRRDLLRNEKGLRKCGAFFISRTSVSV
jgi:hypothetical protein